MFSPAVRWIGSRLNRSGSFVQTPQTGEMSFELVAGLVVVASDCRLLDRAVHAFDLAVSPGMVRFSEAVFDVVLAAAHVERGALGPIGASSTKSRFFHFATVLGSRPWRSASSLAVAFDRCIAALTACVVVALP